MGEKHRTMTEQELAKIEVRLNAITPYPWGWLDGALKGHGHGKWPDIAEGTPDGDFVVCAAEDVRDLLAEVRVLRVLIADLDPYVRHGTLCRGFGDPPYHDCVCHLAELRSRMISACGYRPCVLQNPEERV